MAVATLTSRVLGMVREMVYNWFMGTSWVNDAFQLAFMIPNLFRRLLGEGALTAAFIPVFKEKEKREGEKEMWRAANAVISGVVVVSCVIVAVVMLGVSLVLAYGAPAAGSPAAALPMTQTLTHAAATNLLAIDSGPVHHWGPGQFSERTVLMLRLLRVMFPYMVLVCVTAVMMGILNARGHFFIPAMGAAMLNVVMIASVLWLAPHMGHQLPVQIFALAVGVLLAGVAQAAFQLPTMWKDGFHYHWVSPWKDETVHRVAKQMLPGTIGVAAFQINVVIVQSVAFMVGTGIVSSFNNAVRLMELPQGLFGISLATYLLPTLAGLAAEKKYPEFRSTLRNGLETLVFLNLIASVLLVMLAEPIVRLLFERGAFTAFSTQHVSYALMCLAPGLVMFSTVNILARAFYALGDTKTPMKISIACLVINVAISCLLLKPFRECGLGIANTLTSVVNVGLLTFTLRKKLARLDMEPLKKTLVPLGILTAVGGVIAWESWQLWEHQIGHATLLRKIGAVFAPAILAGSVYVVAAFALKIEAAKELLAFALVKFKRRKISN
jgi:putative peptidoglycan lipid II flippase